MHVKQDLDCALNTEEGHNVMYLGASRARGPGVPTVANTVEASAAKLKDAHAAHKVDETNCVRITGAERVVRRKVVQTLLNLVLPHVAHTVAESGAECVESGDPVTPVFRNYRNTARPLCASNLELYLLLCIIQQMTSHCAQGSFEFGRKCVQVYNPKDDKDTLAILSKLRTFRDEGIYELKNSIGDSDKNIQAVHNLQEAVINEIARIEVVTMSMCAKHKRKSSCESATDCTWIPDTNFFKRMFSYGHCVASQNVATEIGTAAVRDANAAAARILQLEKKTHITTKEKQELHTLREFMSYLANAVVSDKKQLKTLDYQVQLVEGLLHQYSECIKTPESCSTARADQLLSEINKAKTKLEEMSKSTLMKLVDKYGTTVSILLVTLVIGGVMTVVLGTATATIAQGGVLAANIATILNSKTLHTATSVAGGYAVGGPVGAAIGFVSQLVDPVIGLFKKQYLPFKARPTRFKVNIKSGDKIIRAPIYQHSIDKDIYELKLNPKDVPKALQDINGNVNYSKVKAHLV